MLVNPSFPARTVPEFAAQLKTPWAAWQRVHVVEPGWRQDVICNAHLEFMQWDRWTNWQRGDARWNVLVIDTTDLSIDQIVERLVAWIQAESNDHMCQLD